MIKVSVVMPIFNEENHVAAAIESILSQSLGDFELIIINDGSTDNSIDVITRYNDNRISIINKHNSGVADSLNIGISTAKASLIARMDADDMCDHNRLSIQTRFLDSHPDLALVGSWGYVRHEHDAPLRKVILPLKHDNIIRFMQRDNPFIHSSVLFRKEAFLNVGQYKIVQGMEDYDLWIRMASVYQLANVPLFLVTRLDFNNFETKMTYSGLQKSNIYKKRLYYQIMAIKTFGLYPLSIIYLLKTILSIAICNVKSLKVC